ncbi:hypothetical protein PQR46_18555 [Paraburkholderia sediminicola]|uniref:hypothetical protein n=1 Tax=Paraburkholderia sediminicola TaxID=458836 RepID=UPI0038BC56FF
MPLTIEVDQLLSEKRFRKAERRRWRQTKRQRKSRENRLLQEIRFGDSSRIIRMMADAYRPEVKFDRRTPGVRVPEVFSIIDDPEAALNVILGFAKVTRLHRVRKMQFDQSRLKVYDLAANSLLDMVASEMKLEARQRGALLRFSGRYPADPSVRRFIKSLGIVKHLDIRHELAGAPEKEGIRVFERRKRHYDAPSDVAEADIKSRAASGFVDHINDCLEDNSRQLTPAAKQILGAYIGEILGNAEEHAGFVDWTIVGYLDNSLSKPICEIAIFNFGTSIADSMNALDRSSYTWKQVQPFLWLHQAPKAFNRSWRARDLLTVIAMQGNVSTKNTSQFDTRGQGTIELIEFFQRMCEECAADGGNGAKMCILSGSTFLLFDGKYRLKESPGRGKVIAFNAENSLHKRPDPAYVRSLGTLAFPGTIISIRFPLSAGSTVALGGKSNEQANRD